MKSTDGQLCIKVEDFGAKMGLSRRIAYELVQRDDFPKLRIGRRILIPVAGLESWLERQAGGYGSNRNAV